MAGASSRRVRPTGGASVAIVGRPNVGKSTLVNRFAGRRDAIVEPRPGVTRDRTTHAAEWAGRRFTVVDTGGWTPGWAREAGTHAERMDAAVTAQAEAATAAADLVVLLVDATVGVTEEDAAAARWLRGSGIPVLLAANKVDDFSATNAIVGALGELHRLGLGAPVPVSALHGRGSGDLLDAMVDRLRALGAFDRPEEPADDVPGVALIGRPNVGKSSIFNRLLGEQRAIVDAVPGTTRDAVDTVVELADGRAYRFVDTAGLRKHASTRAEATEYYATVRTAQALDRAAVGLLVLDAAETVGEQEQRLARAILDAGRALVLVLNKWDLVDADRREQIDRERDRLLHFVAWAPLVRTSAGTGRGIDKLLPQVDAVLAAWRTRVPTGTLNTWLADAVAATAPPLQAGSPVKVRYITQVAAGPPTFKVFTTGELPPTYVRYLERRLRETYDFAGTPIRIGVRVRTRWEERDAVISRGGVPAAAAVRSRRGTGRDAGRGGGGGRGKSGGR